jgi:uncharacterized protein YkwD
MVNPRERGRRLGVALVGSALAVAGCAEVPPRGGRLADAPTLAPAHDPQAILAQLVEAHNQARTRAGLPPLESEPRLEAAARRHAGDMARRQRLAHRGSDRSSPFERMESEGYHYQRAAENIACGDFSLESLMRSWMTSPGHRRNILGRYRQIGTACATGADGTTYWCVTFGEPSRPRKPS